MDLTHIPSGVCMVGVCHFTRWHARSERMGNIACLHAGPFLLILTHAWRPKGASTPLWLLLLYLFWPSFLPGAARHLRTLVAFAPSRAPWGDRTMRLLRATSVCSYTCEGSSSPARRPASLSWACCSGALARRSTFLVSCWYSARLFSEFLERSLVVRASVRTASLSSSRRVCAGGPHLWQTLRQGLCACCSMKCAVGARVRVKVRVC
jgi:hypothetical protein